MKEPPDASVLNELARHLHDTKEARGFYDKGPAVVSEAVANLHSAASEIWEAYRTRSLDKPCDKAAGMEALCLVPLTCAEEELADIVIQALELSVDLKVDISRAVRVKDLYNQTRGYRNGGKLA